jgi:NADPH:quinone reductase
MPADAMTALRGLDDTLALKPAESVMIFGASGGIGHLAVQLAKRMGARAFAVASGSDGVALVKKLGADAVVDGYKDDIIAAACQFAPNGLHAALITAGGPAADKALTAMRAGGRVAYPNGVEPTPKPPVGIDAKSYEGMPDPEAIEKLNRLIESSGPPGIGCFEVHVARSFPLDQAAEAHRRLTSTISASLSCKRLRVSLTVGAWMGQRAHFSARTQQVPHDRERRVSGDTRCCCGVTQL